MGVRIRGARGLLAAGIAAAAVLPAAPTLGVQRGLMKVDLGQSRTAQFPGIAGNNPAEYGSLVEPTPADCTGATAACDDVPIRLGDPRHDSRHTYVLALQLSVSYTPSVDSVSIYLWDDAAPDYQLVGAANNGANPEALTATVAGGSLYHLVVVNGAGPNSGYRVVARLTGYEAALPNQGMNPPSKQVSMPGQTTTTPVATHKAGGGTPSSRAAAGAASPAPSGVPLQVGAVAAPEAPDDAGAGANVALAVAIAAPVGIALMLWVSTRRRIG